MSRSSPYCQSNTAANAQSPVKISQCSRGARSGTPRVSPSDDMVVTLMFRPPGCGNDDAAFVAPVLPPFRTSCEPKPNASGDQRARGTQGSPSFRGATLGASPESIPTYLRSAQNHRHRVYGFRVVAKSAPRNDDYDCD